MKLRTEIGPISQAPTDKLYSSKNPIVRWLLNRLLKNTSDLLLGIEADSKLGLDVGCGDGYLIDYLSSANAIGPLVAVDIDHHKLKYAKQRFPNKTYWNVDAKKMSFKNNSFDYVIASEVLEHITRPLEAIQELHRVSKERGYIIFSVPYEPFFRWGNVLRGKYWQRGGRTPTHVNFWTRSEIKNYMNEYVEIEKEIWFAVFPWILFLGKFKQTPIEANR